MYCILLPSVFYLVYVKLNFIVYFSTPMTDGASLDDCEPEVQDISMRTENETEPLHKGGAKILKFRR